MTRSHSFVRVFYHSLRPFFGSLLWVSWHFHRFHDMIVDIARDLGDGTTWTSGIIGNPAFIYIGADPAIVEHVLKTAFWKYEKGEWFRTNMDVFLGSGIFNSDGKQWQKQRKVSSHMFTARNLKEDMSTIFLKNAHVVVSKLTKYAHEKKTFDMQDLYFRYTLDSFAEVAFGETGQLKKGCGAPLQSVCIDLLTSPLVSFISRSRLSVRRCSCSLRHRLRCRSNPREWSMFRAGILLAGEEILQYR